MVNDREEIKLAPKERIKKDVAYIKNEIIAKQPNGNYCKWSRLLKTVSVINFTREQFETYWKRQYKSSQVEYIDKIHKACEEKFTTGLIDTNTLIEMIEKSHDFESEKTKALSYLKGTKGLKDNEDEEECDEDE